MPETEQYEQRLLAHVEEKIEGRLECPVCGTSSWSTEGIFQLLSVNVETQTVSDSEGLSVMPLVCDNCKFTRLFTASEIVRDGNR